MPRNAKPWAARQCDRTVLGRTITGKAVLEL
jgi:hypothetical protein